MGWAVVVQPIGDGGLRRAALRGSQRFCAGSEQEQIRFHLRRLRLRQVIGLPQTAQVFVWLGGFGSPAIHRGASNGSA